MSRCECDNSTEYRITGEVLEYPPSASNPVTGNKQARIRCAECSGKVAFIGTDLLNILGIGDEDIKPAMGIDETVNIEIDLI